MDILQKKMLRSILNHRNWEDMLLKFNVVFDSKYFTDKKARMIYDIIKTTEGNIYEMRKNTQLINERVDISNLYPNIELVAPIEAYDELRVSYNKTRYKEVVDSTMYDITDGNELNASLLNIQSEVSKLIVEETDTTISLAEYAHNVEQEDLLRTDEVIGYKLNKFSEIEEATAGIQSGFIIITGNPNAGKSILTCSLEVDLLQSNKDLHILKVSLDDSKRDCVYTLKSICSNGVLSRNDIKRSKFLKGNTRYITSFKTAGSGIGSRNIEDTISYKQSERKATTFNVIGKADAENEYRKASEEFNRNIASRMTIVGQEDLKDYNHLENMLRKYLRNNKKKLVVTIDGIMNLDISRNIIGNDINSMHDTRANLLKRLADIYDVPLIVTTEVRKIEGFNGKFREPHDNDIKYSTKYQFNAKLIMLISHNKDFWNQNQVYNKLIISKNKFTGLRPNYFYELKREEACMTFDSYQNHSHNYCEMLYEDSTQIQSSSKTKKFGGE